MGRKWLIFFITLGAGVIAGYLSRSSAKVERDIETKRSVREANGAGMAWDTEALVKASEDRMRAAAKKGNTYLTGELANWSIDEIRAALEESVKSPDALYEFTQGRAAEKALLVEWMRRDFAGALGWFEGLESDYVKVRMLPALSQHWPKEHGLEAIDFALKYRGRNGWDSPWQLFSTGISKAAEGGPAAVNEVLRRLRENDADPRNLRELEFPAGFDFRSFMGGDEFARLREKQGHFAFAEAWSLQDPEGACRWLKEEGGGIRQLVSLAACGDDGSADARLRWMGGEMGNWPEKEQDEFFKEGVLRQWHRDPEVQILMAEGAKDPAMAERIRKTGIQTMYEGLVASGLKVLGTIPDPARRIELLMEADRRNQGPARLYPQGEITLRAKLREWNATEAQVETIISRFRK